MKRKIFLTLLALISVGSMSVWATNITATLTGTNMVTGTSTSYADYTSTGVTDDDSNTYYGRWCYAKYNSAMLNMIQLKKVESSNSSRIQLPTFGGDIQKITITATYGSANVSTGEGAKTTLLIVKGNDYTSKYATTAANQVLTAGSSSTATKSYTFDFTTLDDAYDGSNLYICSKDAAIRIWSIAVEYAEASYYNAIYKYNDGVTADKVVRVNKGDDANAYKLEAAPIRENFTFIGWSDGTNTYAAGASYALTASTTFTAQWTFSGETTNYKRSSKSA